MAETPFPFRSVNIPLTFVTSGKKLDSLSINAFYAVVHLLSNRVSLLLASLDMLPSPFAMRSALNGQKKGKRRPHNLKSDFSLRCLCLGL